MIKSDGASLLPSIHRLLAGVALYVFVLGTCCESTAVPPSPPPPTERVTVSPAPAVPTEVMPAPTISPPTEVNPPTKSAPTEAMSVPTASTSVWMARQHLNFPQALASVNALDVLESLPGDFTPVLPGGYITTDPRGQAEATNGGACLVHIFQTSSLFFTEEHISSCPKGMGASSCANDSTYMVRNCPGIKIVTLSGEITMNGTTVTIVEHRDPGTDQGFAAVFVSEGSVRVLPSNPDLQVFDVGTLQAAYVPTVHFVDASNIFYKIQPGAALDLSTFVLPIQTMKRTDQIQRANLLLQANRLQMLPLDVPYKLGVSWLNEQQESVTLSEAITGAVDWSAVAAKASLVDTPMYMLAQEKVTPLTEKSSGLTLIQAAPWILKANQPYQLQMYQPYQLQPYQPFQIQNRYLLLDKAGIAQGQQKQIVLLYDGTIPGSLQMADDIAQQLMSDQSFVVTVREVMPDTAHAVFTEFDQAGVPTLVLGGY